MALDTLLADGEASVRDSGVRLTADREELKYLVPAVHALRLEQQLSGRLAPHRYRNAAPRTHAYATTVYFDTPGRDLYLAAIAEPLHVKVRVREYYEMPLDAGDPAQAVPASDSPGMVWLELKARDGRRSRKRRACVHKRELGRWFGALERDDGELGNGACDGGELGQIAAELRRLRAELRAPLVPSCVVNYRRLSWQDTLDSLRVTLDSEVCAFAPPTEPWNESTVLARRALGAPALEERRCVLEIKSLGALPSWVGELLRACGAVEVHYSKFVMASARRARTGVRSA